MDLDSGDPAARRHRRPGRPPASRARCPGLRSDGALGDDYPDVASTPGGEGLLVGEQQLQTKRVVGEPADLAEVGSQQHHIGRVSAQHAKTSLSGPAWLITADRIGVRHRCTTRSPAASPVLLTGCFLLVSECVVNAVAEALSETSGTSGAGHCRSRRAGSPTASGFAGTSVCVIYTVPRAAVGDMRAARVAG